MTESEIKAECERLARKAWPWKADCDDPLAVSLRFPTARVWHPHEEASCGIQITHESRAPEAILAALRVLAGEPDPRDAEIERLRAALARSELDWRRTRFAAERLRDSACRWQERAWTWKRLAKRLRWERDGARMLYDAYIDAGVRGAPRHARMGRLARSWKRLAKRLRQHHRNALWALGEAIERGKRLEAELRGREE